MKNDNFDINTKIIDDLNNMLCVYSRYTESMNVLLAYDKKSREYIFKRALSYVKAVGFAGISSIVAENMFDSDIPFLPQAIMTLGLGIAGGYLLDRDACERFCDETKNLYQVLEVYDKVEEELKNCSFDLFESISYYLVVNDCSFEDFCNNNLLYEIFSKNEEYIKTQQKKFKINHDFSFDHVSRVFNDFYGFHNGVYDWYFAFDKSLESDLKMVRK